MTGGHHLDVLVVGAGPTGLAMAAQLAAFGVRPRLVDRALDRVHESRALAIQPRTLEVLAGIGVSADLVAHGNPTRQFRLHAGGREVAVPLFDTGLDDTAYPYLLFLSQAETERILAEHLAGVGVVVERGVELVDLTRDGDVSIATLRDRDGRDEMVTARCVVGCDGAHSAVRRLTGIPFEGGSYPQTFVLADAEADGLEPGMAHAFLAERGLLLYFPLGTPATWRLLALRRDQPVYDGGPTLAEVQAISDRHTGGTVRLRDPVWMTNFRLHHRAAARYRAGPVFLAGDAAHIHSPAGGQGMNTGIQDAVNLAWKLAQVLAGAGPAALLDTYEPERAPVGARVVALTDRAFRVATSANPVVGFARTRVVPRLLPLLLRPRAPRAYGFRLLSELAIRYRNSPLSVDGPDAPRAGPRAGDRLPHPDRLATVHDGHHGWRLLARDGIRYLIRPDGHIGYRGSPAGLDAYLQRWLPGARDGVDGHRWRVET